MKYILLGNGSQNQNSLKCLIVLSCIISGDLCNWPDVAFINIFFFCLVRAGQYIFIHFILKTVSLSTIIVPLHMRKPRHREVKLFVQGHTVTKCESRGQELNVAHIQEALLWYSLTGYKAWWITHRAVDLDVIRFKFLLSPYQLNDLGQVNSSLRDLLYSSAIWK